MTLWRLRRVIPNLAHHPLVGYHDASGALLGYILRFDGVDGSSFARRRSMRPRGGAPEWRWEAWPVPRPLYGLDRLAARRSAFVVICEGENRLTLRRVCCRSSFASPRRTARKARQGRLERSRGRDMTVWRDADAPGWNMRRRSPSYAQRPARPPSPSLRCPKASRKAGTLPTPSKTLDAGARSRLDRCGGIL